MVGGVAVMEVTTLTQVLDAADTVTTSGLLLLLFVAWIKGWIVSPREVNAKDELIKTETETITRLIQERNDWQQIALQAMNLGERTVTALGNRRGNA